MQLISGVSLSEGSVQLRLLRPERLRGLGEESLSSRKTFRAGFDAGLRPRDTGCGGVAPVARMEGGGQISEIAASQANLEATLCFPY